MKMISMKNLFNFQLMALASDLHAKETYFRWEDGIINCDDDNDDDDDDCDDDDRDDDGRDDDDRDDEI